MSEPMMTVTEATFVVKVARRYLRPQGVSTQDWEQQKAALKETVPDAESLVISFSDDDSDEDATKTRREANQFSRRLESTLSELRNLHAQPSGASSSRAAVLLRFPTWANNSCHIHTFLGILFNLIDHGYDGAFRPVGLGEAIRSGHAALRRGASAKAVAMLLRGLINGRSHLDHVSVLAGRGHCGSGPGNAANITDEVALLFHASPRVVGGAFLAPGCETFGSWHDPCSN
jgi:hypothetical protein